VTNGQGRFTKELVTVTVGSTTHTTLTATVGSTAHIISSDHTLRVSSGYNTLVGGPGHDTFVFNTSLGPHHLDKVVNFSPAEDKIELARAVFTTLHAGELASAAFWVGAKAHDASDRIIYNPTTGALFYDSDGNGPYAPVHFATLSPHLSLSHADFFVV
jgi:Ca2+-binding RTX toxin-like protein